MNNQINRIPCLDGLRAISITLVIFSHFSEALGVDIYIIGNLGVRVFFVISGFLITSILAEEYRKTSDVNLKKFYFRRLLRIFPAYYFYLLVILILAATGVLQIRMSDFLYPFSYTSNYFSPLPWEIGHTWSLSVEEQFYLIFPGLLLFLKVSRTKKFLLAVLLITPLIRLLHIFIIGESNISFWFTSGFHINMDALASGCALALFKDAFSKNKHYKEFINSVAGLLCLISLTAIITFVFSDFSLFYYSIGLTSVNIFIALCISWLIDNHQGKIGKILNSNLLVFIGTLSYSLYLWQEPFSKYTEEKWWTHFPQNIILIMLFSIFSYYVIEKKFLSFRQKMENNVFDKTPRIESVQVN